MGYVNAINANAKEFGPEVIVERRIAPWSRKIVLKMGYEY